MSFKIKLLILFLALPITSFANIHENVISAINKELISSGIFGSGLGEGSHVGLVRGNRYRFDPETSFELECSLHRLYPIKKEVSCTLSGERYSGGTWINSAGQNWVADWMDKGYKIVNDWRKGDSTEFNVFISQKLESVTNFQIKKIEAGGKGSFKQLFKTFDLDSTKYFFVKAHGKYAEKYECNSFHGCIFHISELKKQVKKTLVSKKTTTNILMNGNKIISKFDSGELTTLQEKIFKNKFLNKEFLFFGKVYDIVSFREIDLMLDYDNYAKVKFNMDLPISLYTTQINP